MRSFFFWIFITGIGFSKPSLPEIAHTSIEEKLPAIKEYVETARKTWGSPGVSVAIIEKGEVYYLNSGTAKMGTDTPITQDSLFCIMSLSKVVTCSILQQLVDEGKVDFDAPVIQYLPWFKLADPEATKTAKVRHLVSHCIGLPQFSGDTFLDFGFSKKEILEKLSKTPLKHKPGEKYAYQNMFVGIAGMLIETVLKKPLPEIAQERIFQKLDMQHTFMGKAKVNFWSPLLNFFGIHKNSKIGQFVTGHKHLNGKATPMHLLDEPYIFNGTSGVNSCTSDYIKLIACFLNEGVIQFGPNKGQRLMSQRAWDTISSLQTPIKTIRESNVYFPVIRIKKGSFYYGNGMFGAQYGFEDRYANILFHTGAGANWRAFWGAFPDYKLGCVVLSNYGSVNSNILSEVISYKIFDLYFKMPPYDWNSERYKIIQKSRNYLKNCKELWIPIPSVPYAQIARTYHNDTYGDVEIELQKDQKLFLKYKGTKAKIDFISGNLFSLNPSEMYDRFGDDDRCMISFQYSNQGTIDRLKIDLFREDSTFKVINKK